MGKISFALAAFVFVSMCAMLFAGLGDNEVIVVRPNYVVQEGDPFVSPQPGYAGGFVSVAVVAANTGSAEQNEWSRIVATPSGNPAIDAQSVEVPPLRAREEGEVEFNFRCPQVQSATEYTVEIEIDPDNRVNEGNENDYALQGSFVCSPLPNLVLELVQNVEPREARGGESVSIGMRVRNAGRGDTPQGVGISVQGDAAANGAPQIMGAATQIDPLGSGQSRDVSFSFTCPDVAARTIYYIRIAVNPQQRIVESSYNDNTYPGQDQIAPSFACLPAPNLVAREGEPLLQPREAQSGDTIRINAIIANIGHEAAAQSHASVEFSGNVQIAPISVPVQSIGSGAVRNIAFEVTCPHVENRVAYSFVVRADSENEIRESVEAGNYFEARYFTCAPHLANLVLQPGSPFVSPQIAREGERVALKVGIANSGGRDADGFDVVATVQGSPHIDAQSVRVNSLSPNSMEEREFVFECPRVQSATTYSVEVVADPSAQVEEGERGDNLLSPQPRFTCAPPAGEGGGGAGFGEVCGSNSMQQNVTLSFFALAATSLVVALAYMGGKAIENPKISNWCKIEVWQVIASAIIVAGVYAAISLFCVATPLQIVPFTGIGNVRGELDAFGGGFENQGMYVATQAYLERLASYTKGVMTAVRYNMGVYELTSGVQKFHCDAFCLLASAGKSFAPYGGDSSYVSVLQGSLQISTIALLSVLFQLFVLLYINSGLFLVFLPIAIVVRSLPFMRGFGGALIALVVCLYILYPLMLYVDGIVIPPASKAIAPALSHRVQPGDGSVYPLLGAVRTSGVGGEDILVKNAFSMWEERRDDIDDIPQLVSLVAFAFIAGVFAPALNFVVIAAAAREMAKVLGDEIDISRMGQML